MKKYWMVSTLLGLAGVSAQAAPSKLALNWKPEPEFGGFYEASLKGFYKKAGLDIEVQPGGVGTPVAQMLAAGQVDYGVVSGDDVLLARAQGQDIVAIFSVYDHSPHGILTHEERGFKTIGDVFSNPGTLAIQPGTPFALFLKKKYAPLKVKTVPYGGGVSVFLQDKNHSQQGFITSETLLAQKSGAKVKTFMISESGFDPYVEVVAVRGDFLRKNEAAVKKFVEATREGWEAYAKDGNATDAQMNKLNPSMDVATFHESARVQLPFLHEAKTKMGMMLKARWDLMVHQLKDLQVLKKEISADDAFKNY